MSRPQSWAGHQNRSSICVVKQSPAPHYRDFSHGKADGYCLLSLPSVTYYSSDPEALQSNCHNLHRVLAFKRWHLISSQGFCRAGQNGLMQTSGKASLRENSLKHLQGKPKYHPLLSSTLHCHILSYIPGSFNTSPSCCDRYSYLQEVLPWHGLTHACLSSSLLTELSVFAELLLHIARQLCKR